MSSTQPQDNGDLGGRCGACWAMPTVVHLDRRDYRQGNVSIPRCRSCGFQSAVVWDGYYTGGLVLVEVGH